MIPQLPEHQKLTSSRKTLTEMLSVAIEVARYVEYELDDQGGRHALTGQQLTVLGGPNTGRSLIVWDRTTDVAWFADEEKALIAAVIGCSADNVCEPSLGPKFVTALYQLRFGLSLSGLFGPHRINPCGAAA